MKIKIGNILSVISLLMLLFYINACNTTRDENGDTSEDASENFDENALQVEQDKVTTLEQDTVPLVERVDLEAMNFVFLPPEIILSPGQVVIFYIKNNGETDHSFELQLSSGKIELGHIIPPGESDSLRVKMPTEPGEYKFICPVDNHHSMGMQGVIMIQD